MLGVALGVVVLVISLGLVALMMWSEWSQPAESQPLAEAAAPAPKKSARKAAPKKKAAAKKKKK